MTNLDKPQLNIGVWLDPNKQGVPKEKGEYWCWDGEHIYKESFCPRAYDWNDVYLYQKINSL